LLLRRGRFPNNAFSSIEIEQISLHTRISEICTGRLSRAFGSRQRQAKRFQGILRPWGGLPAFPQRCKKGMFRGPHFAAERRTPQPLSYWKNLNVNHPRFSISIFVPSMKFSGPCSIRTTQQNVATAKKISQSTQRK
jgi:hypothetical protein